MGISQALLSEVLTPSQYTVPVTARAIEKALLVSGDTLRLDPLSKHLHCTKCVAFAQR